jgi:4-hydroxyphenylpyruvate dioxygenase
MTTHTTDNPCGLEGIAFIAWADDTADKLDTLFASFGFSRTMRLRRGAIDLYEQGEIAFLLNTDADSYAGHFRRAHGPSIYAMGWKVRDAIAAFETAVGRGARPYKPGEDPVCPLGMPAIYGIGDSLIFFVDDHSCEGGDWRSLFGPHPNPARVSDKGFVLIDHLTNNVEKGTLGVWQDFYKDIFGFTEVRHFDIRGEETGLFSYALRSPDGSFCIPINEGTEEKSQIEEYLREYNGPGIQHIALLTADLLASLRMMEGSAVRFLDIDDEYYGEVFDRVPDVTEDHAEIQRLQVLVDGDDDGYLLQIFTQNVVGPIFFELIQRKNHLSFGEGNFGALFRSIERDQQRRGVL